MKMSVGDRKGSHNKQSRLGISSDVIDLFTSSLKD